ncbi:hypothetical protein [Paenibacillus sp. MMO-58]
MIAANRAGCVNILVTTGSGEKDFEIPIRSFFWRMA